MQNIVACSHCHLEFQKNSMITILYFFIKKNDKKYYQTPSYRLLMQSHWIDLLELGILIFYIIYLKKRLSLNKGFDRLSSLYFTFL